jgi:hypothetical protein
VSKKFNHLIQNPLLLVTEPRTRDNIKIKILYAVERTSKKKELGFLDDIRISLQTSSSVKNSGTADNRHSDATELTLLRQSCQHPVTAVSLMLLRRPHPTLSFYIPYNSTVAVRILCQELFRFRMNFLRRVYTRTFHATGHSRFLFFLSPKG